VEYSRRICGVFEEDVRIFEEGQLRDIRGGTLGNEPMKWVGNCIID
jgi:hypothetical protein